MEQSHTKLELSFTEHTTQQPIKEATGLKRNSYMMGIIRLAKILYMVRHPDIQVLAKDGPNTNFLNETYTYFQDQPTFFIMYYY
jgi:hypothetical protein